MKRLLWSLLAAELCLATTSHAQSLGSLTENGVAMEVKGIVAALDPAKPSIKFYLLPFQPSSDETAKLQGGQYWVMRRRPSPDPKKWNACPWGELTLEWKSAKESVGDAKKAEFSLISYNLSAANSESIVLKPGKDVAVTLTGTVKDGQDVTVTTKGSDVYTDGRGKKSNVAWDLKVQGKLLASKKE